jgi:ornithine carbamoyltransferase
VNDKLIALAKKDVIFMHPLPAHPGEETAKGILRPPASVVFDQAENRLHAQRALLIELFGKTGKK